jgi:hypothetical protein
MKSTALIPNVQAVTLTNGDQEYSLNLSPGCEKFTIKARTADVFRFAFVTGNVAGPTAPYATILAGNSYSSPEKYRVKMGTTKGQTAATTQTIYFASSTPGVIVELAEWTQ